MQCIAEPARKYDNLENLRQDLAIMDVRETEPFRLDQMRLSKDGTVQVMGQGEYPLTEIALGDALRRGGLHMACCQNFFAEQQPVLDDCIVNAANAYYRHSHDANSEIKLVTRSDVSGRRVALGIPSRSYCLFTHEQAVDKIVNNISGDLRLARANVYAQFLEIAFTHPLQVVKDKIGKIVETGLSFLNSQGTRTTALTVAAFCLRLVCTNGSTSNQKLFTARYVHKGDMRNHDNRFAHDTKDIFERFALMMQGLPRLGDMPITDKFIERIQPDLVEAIHTQETEHFLATIDKEHGNIGEVWDKITNMPHKIADPEAKLKLENLGFKILTMHLSYN